MSVSRDVQFKVGKGFQDGMVRLSTFIPQVLTLSVSYKAERAATVMMTREQVRDLQLALAVLESTLGPEEVAGEKWAGGDHRPERSQSAFAG